MKRLAEGGSFSSRKGQNVRLQLSKVQQPLRPLALVVVLVLAVGAHVYVSLLGPEYRGVALPLSHLFDLAAVLLLMALCAAAGRFALTRWPMPDAEPIEELVFSIAIGSGIIATLILLLGSLGALHELSIGFLCVIVAWTARRELNAVPTLVRRALAQLAPRTDERGAMILGTAVLTAVALFLLAMALAPPVDWDSLMYHLQVPADFLREGRIYVPADNLHVSRVGLFHMLYLPLLAAQSSVGPALLNASVAALLGLAAFALAARFFGARTAGLSLAILWGSTAIILVAITPRLDVTLTFFVFLAHYSLLRAFSSSIGWRQHFLLAAVLLGFATGIKYHALAYSVGLVPLVIWIALRHERNFISSLRPLVIFGALASVAALPWLAKNWLLLGAPLHPFLSKPILQPWLEQAYGSENLLASVNPEIFQIIWQARTSFNVWDAFFAPGRISIESEGVYYFANPVLLLLPFSLLLIRNRTMTWLLIPSALYLFVLLVPFPLTNLRYLVPAAVPLTIAAVYTLSRALDRIGHAKARTALLALAVVLALVPSARTAYTRLSRTEALQHLIGRSSESEYLATHDLPEVRIYSLLMRFVNAELSPESRILMLFEARGYYLRPSVVQDNKATNWPLLAQALPADACLARARVTHVLVATGSLRYYLAGGVDATLLKLEELDKFANECSTLIYEGPGYALFKME